MPPTWWRQHVEDKVHSWLIGRVAGVVHSLVVKHPQLTFAHHDPFTTRSYRAATPATQHEVEAVPNTIVGSGINVRTNPPAGLQRHQGSATQVPVLRLGYVLAKLQRVGESGRGPGHPTLMHIVGVLGPRRQGLSGDPQKDVQCVALATNLTLTAGVGVPNLGCCRQFRQKRSKVNAPGDSNEA